LQITDTIIKKTYYDQAYYYISLDYTVQPFIDSPDTIQVDQPFSLNASKTNLPDVDILQYYWRFGDGSKAKGLTQKHHFDAIGTYAVQLGVIGVSNGDTTNYCVTKNIVVQDKQPNKNNVTENLIPSAVEDTSIVNNFENFSESSEDTTNTIYSVEIKNSDSKFNGDEFKYKMLRSLKEELLHSDDDAVQEFINRLPKDDFIYKLLNNYEVQMERTEGEDVYSYLIGHWNEIQDAHSTWSKVQNLGIGESVVKSSNISEINGFPINKVFEMEKLHFDSNKWNIKSEAKGDLDKITSILDEYPFITLNISAFTDASGPEKYNMILSKNRAQSVMKYIIGKGIDKTRIVAVGYGEAIPVGDNRTEEGRRKNRRVEFKLVFK